MCQSIVCTRLRTQWKIFIKLPEVTLKFRAVRCQWRLVIRMNKVAFSINCVLFHVVLLLREYAYQYSQYYMTKRSLSIA